MTTDKTLVVGDVHVAPKQNLRRAKWLGHHIKATKPDRVVFIGDFLSFDSLSGWDRDKRRKMELRRYKSDIDSGKRFLGDMLEAAENTDTDYIFVEGNHEDRLHRYLDNDPTFDGFVDYRKDLGIAEWTFIPYRESYVHRGVHFTHIPIMENGRPTSGKYVASRALDVYGAPVVFGHTHKLNMACVHRKGQAHLQMAVNVGCYFEHIDEYAMGSQTSYWRGLVELDHYKHCGFDVNAIRLGHLKRMYE